MKAYVINLPRSEGRRQHMEQQLGRLGVDHEFVSGVDGKALTDAERRRWVDESAVAKYPKWLTPGQIGCSLSHLRAYERILATDDDVALVLEDDVSVCRDLPAVAKTVAGEMRGAEVVLLYYRSFAPCRFSALDVTTIDPGVELVYPLDVRQPITTAAYLITREACRSLAEMILPVRAGADSWGHFYESGAIDALRCVVPWQVALRKEFKSTIDYVDERSLRLRATTFVARHHLFPLFQLMTLNRRLVERRMSKTLTVPERSPLAYGNPRRRPSAI